MTPERIETLAKAAVIAAQECGYADPVVEAIRAAVNEALESAAAHCEALAEGHRIWGSLPNLRMVFGG